MEFALKDLRYEITRLCNMSCPSCYMESTKKDWLADMLSVEEFEAILSEAIPLGVEKVSFTGGEPLIESSRILHSLPILKSRDVHTRLFTNGSLLTDKMMGKLAGAGMNEILVSIDGLEATHDEFRGYSGSFKLALNALSLVRRYRDDGMVSGARITITSENYREIPELMEKHLLPLGLTKYNVRPFQPAGRGMYNPKYLLTPKQHEEVMSYLAELQKPGIRINFLGNCYAFLYGGEDKQCTCGVSQGYITFDGKFKPCGYFPIILGDCRKRSIGEIWNSDNSVLEALRHPSIPNKCIDCAWHKNPCAGGCRASAFNTYKSFVMTDPTCPVEAK